MIPWEEQHLVSTRESSVLWRDLQKCSDSTSESMGVLLLILGTGKWALLKSYLLGAIRYLQSWSGGAVTQTEVYSWLCNFLVANCSLSFGKEMWWGDYKHFREFPCPCHIPRSIRDCVFLVCLLIAHYAFWSESMIKRLKHLGSKYLIHLSVSAFFTERNACFGAQSMCLNGCLPSTGGVHSLLR